MLDYLRSRTPSLVNELKDYHPCYFTNVPNKEYIYKTDKNGVHYAYGFSGTGFKFFPLHGKIVYDCVFGSHSFDKWKMRYSAKL